MYVEVNKNLKNKKTYVIVVFYTVEFFVQNNYITMGVGCGFFWYTIKLVK